MTHLVTHSTRTPGALGRRASVTSAESTLVSDGLAAPDFAHP